MCVLKYNALWDEEKIDFDTIYKMFRWNIFRIVIVRTSATAGQQTPTTAEIKYGSPIQTESHVSGSLFICSEKKVGWKRVKRFLSTMGGFKALDNGQTKNVYGLGLLGAWSFNGFGKSFRGYGYAF
jgi:hypothetical protein